MATMFHPRHSILLFLGILAAVTTVAGTSDDELFTKYGCHGPQGISEGCTQSYSLALRSQWNSGGEDYFLYDIVLNALPSSDFPLAEILFGFNVGTSAVFTQTWGMSLSSDNTQGGVAYYSIDFSQGLQPGATWTGSGFVVKGNTVSLFFYEDGRCNYTRYYAIKAQRCQSGSTASAAATTTGAPATPAVSSTTSFPSSAPSVVCDASISSSIIQSNNWSDGLSFFSQFDIKVQNTVDYTINNVTLAILFDRGSIVQSWNLLPTTNSYSTSGSSFDMIVYNLAPGATFSGAGFVYSVNIGVLNSAQFAGNLGTAQPYSTIAHACHTSTQA